MGDKTLNDQIEGVFRGIVFILLSFLWSVVFLALRPNKGYVILLRRLRKKGKNQVRPFVFAFLALTLVFFLPGILDALAPHAPGPYEYQVHDSEYPEVGGLGRAYQQTTKDIESKAATSIFVAAIVGVAALYLGSMLLGFVFLRQGSRRPTWRDGLLFIAGLQIILFGAALVIDRQEGWPSISTIGSIQNILLSPTVLIPSEGDVRPYSIWVDLVMTLILILILIVPVGFVRRFVRYAHWSQATGGSCKRGVIVGTLLLCIGVDATNLAAFAISAYVSDEIQPREAPEYPFAMQYLDCRVAAGQKDTSVTATVTLAITGKEAWPFEDGDFKMFIFAERQESDGPASSRSKYPDRISLGEPLDLTISAISPKLGPPPFLVQVGQSVLVQIKADVPPGLPKFLEEHPSDQRCTVYYDLDYPIGAIGSLRSNP